MELSGTMIEMKNRIMKAEIVLRQIRKDSNPAFLKRLADEYFGSVKND
tara:strand:+ start:68895 stop:69038 length:144 start_codon:yes stop_codon:yes gene_type:complete